MPWLDAEKIGPFVPGHYLFALLGFGLPTLLITGAAFFALATGTRSMMWTYVGAVALLVLYFIMRGLLHVVGHDHDREVLLEFLDQLLDAAGGDRVQRRGRFVQQQHFRLQRHRAGDAQALLLAAGQR